MWVTKESLDTNSLNLNFDQTVRTPICILSDIASVDCYARSKKKILKKTYHCKFLKCIYIYIYIYIYIL